VNVSLSQADGSMLLSWAVPNRVWMAAARLPARSEPARHWLMGLCREAIRQGCQELERQDVLPEGRVRRKGTGQKGRLIRTPILKADLERLIDPVTRGDPEPPLALDV
jgi:hypothetical protein